MKLKNILEIIKLEQESIDYKKYSFDEQFLIDDAIFLGELLNPDQSFKYWGNKGWFYYEDTPKNLYFVRLTYQPLKSNPHFELKTGWLENNDEGSPVYDPMLPDNANSKDTNLRGNTVAKIYRDEIIPFFKKQKLADKLIIKPISIGRYKFSIRMVKKFTPNDIKIIENCPDDIIIQKQL